MDCCELVTFVSALTCAIANCVDEDQLGVVAAVFVQLGDSLTTFQACQDACETSSNSKSSL